MKAPTCEGEEGKEVWANEGASKVGNSNQFMRCFNNAASNMIGL
jgi:hypothetical protein